jgi:hypothetical protein
MDLRISYARVSISHKLLQRVSFQAEHIDGRSSHRLMSFPHLHAPCPTPQLRYKISRDDSVITRQHSIHMFHTIEMSQALQTVQPQVSTASEYENMGVAAIILQSRATS